jgi:hypothetical protein
MLNVFERFFQSGDCCRGVKVEADGAFVPVIGPPCEDVSRLNDLRAVENLLVNFVGETLLDTERQLYDFRIPLGPRFASSA